MLSRSTQKSNLAVLAVWGVLIKKASDLEKQQSTPKTPKNFMDLESPGTCIFWGITRTSLTNSIVHDCDNNNDNNDNNHHHHHHHHSSVIILLLLIIWRIIWKTLTPPTRETPSSVGVGAMHLGCLIGPQGRGDLLPITRWLERRFPCE